MIWAAGFLVGLLFSPLAALGWCLLERRLFGAPLRLRTLAFKWLRGAACGATVWLALGVLACGTGASASALAALAVWLWTRRKDLKRALRALGHKARARLAAMARNMPRPSPVLRPVPQGAPS